MSQLIAPTKTFGRYRRLLVEKQAELLAELKSRHDDAAGLLEPVPEEDQPAAEQESSIAEQLNAIESAELSRVNAALKRLRNGAYGICERCGSSIPAARLLAVPWVEHCRKCESPGPERQVVATGRVH